MISADSISVTLLIEIVYSHGIPQFKNIAVLRGLSINIFIFVSIYSQSALHKKVSILLQHQNTLSYFLQIVFDKQSLRNGSKCISSILSILQYAASLRSYILNMIV